MNGTGALFAAIRAEDDAHRSFLIWQRANGAFETISRRGFWAEALHWTTRLEGLSLADGDRVLIRMDSNPVFLAAWTGALLAGAVPVVIGPAATAGEIGVLARLSGARHIISARDTDAGLIGIDVSETQFPEVTALPPARDLGNSPKKLAAIFPTSGTTSEPKLVCYSQHNLLWAASVSASHANLDDRSVGCLCLPLNHVNGMMYSFLASMYRGSAIVLLEQFSAPAFWDAVMKHGCNWASVVQSVVRALQSAGQGPAHGLRNLFWGRYEMRAQEQLGVTMTPWYSMTETVSHPIVGPDVGKKEGSMGIAAKEYQVRLAREDGSTPSCGSSARLLVRGTPGKELFLGYFCDGRVAAPPLDDDGYFDTGDLAHRDEDGHFFYDGRSALMARVGGENVNPLEVEAIIRMIERVVDVVVVPIGDHLLGQRLVAAVEIRPGVQERELRASLTSAFRDIAKYKRPTEVLVVPQMPLTRTAKPDRRMIEALFDDDSMSRLPGAWVLQLEDIHA